MPRPCSPPLLRGLLAATVLGLAGPASALTLDDALAAAERNSTGLALAREQTVVAEALRAQAWALVSPKVVGEGSYTINDKEILVDFTEGIPQSLKDSLGLDMAPITLQRKTAWAASGSVIQPLFTASSLPLLRGAYKNLDAARSSETSAREQVRGGTAKVYYGLAVARGMRELAEKAVASAKSHLELAQKQVSVGLAPDRAALQAEIAVSKAERDVASADAGVLAASQAFANLTGLPTNTEVSLPDAPVVAPPSVDEALATALVHRPDLAAAEARVAAAGLQTTAERLDWLPTLDGRFTYAYSQTTGFSDDPTIWMLVFKASWTLWDGGNRLALTRQYASQARQATLMETQTRQATETDVRTAWEELKRADLSLHAVERERDLSAENLRLAEVGFQAGGVTWLEVEDARLGLLAGEMTALQERANRDLAAIDLRVAMGDY